MAEEIKKERRRWERMKDTYRLVIFNNDTFEEVKSFNLSPLNVYVMLSTLVVLVSAVAIAAIVFTPIKRLIPGYGTANTHPEMVRIYKDIDSLEHLLAAQERYNQGIKKLLTADVEYAPAEPPAKKEQESSHEPIPASEEDAKLRNEVEMGDIRKATGSAAPVNPVNISPREVPLEQMHFSTPIGGSIVAGFDTDKKHNGVDVVAPKNTPVKAALDGWVISSDWTLETGNTIAIQHTNNIVTFYKHNSVLLKKAGSYVRGGEAIAIIGNTGELTDGPHLHFELWHQGKPVNPTDFVDFK
ncbi:MAG: M23 family metallopeptidase [Saprospiraceae bacterium]|nr:M23 family metallopeptidase [Saprospiraceae bacterium]MCF8251652.1 M23 family metallopeptidase [Saprospiraceae bacterium]MCF8281062.1 M23 family metallopeptidase [Bacteroidales bacterium]MCF8313271.1 M23 family metallopeptidase [Saprospiraceae bacterium]MCF8442015.1 M23 family metallopeptidase [Saprospiraceae bacterium]